MGDDCILGLIQ